MTEQTTITDADRYRWLMTNCVETARDNDGEEMSYFLHFDATERFESVGDAIDRQMRADSSGNSLMTDNPTTISGTVPWNKVTEEVMRAWAAELVSLRNFVQWVADHSNDPDVVHEAVLHGADLSEEQVDVRGF